MRKLLTTLPRFRRAAAELPVLAERESWTRSAIETFQLERLNKVWEAAHTCTLLPGVSGPAQLALEVLLSRSIPSWRAETFESERTRSEPGITH